MLEHDPQSLGVTIGKGIRAARGRMGQVALASAIGTDQGTVSKWENGKQRPTLEDLAAIEDATGRPRGWVLVYAGCVAEVRSIEDAIALDPRLTDEQRVALAGSLDGLLRMR